jgi:hypothetical protein
MGSLSSSAAVGTPGAEYLLALHHLVTGNTPPRCKWSRCLSSALSNFMLVIIPSAFYLTEPGRAGEQRRSACSAASWRTAGPGIPAHRRGHRALP